MDGRAVTRLRAVLEGRRDQLQATALRIQQELRSTTTRHADTGDQAVATFDKNILHQQAEQATRQLRLLDDALRRIDAGDYGECVMCRRDIAVVRLQAIPWARYCVDCQELQEGLANR